MAALSPPIGPLSAAGVRAVHNSLHGCINCARQVAQLAHGRRVYIRRAFVAAPGLAIAHRSMRVALLRYFGFACVFAASRLAVAQSQGAIDPPTQPSASESEEETLVQQALDHRRAGQHQDAVVLLRRAYAIRRSPRACGQLAFAEQAIGRWARAEALFREALAATDDPWVARNREALEGSMAAAARRLATVEIMGGDDGAELWVDGERAGILPTDRSLRVVVGTVRIEHRPASMGPPTTRVVELAPGGRERVYFAPREPSTAPSSNSANRVMVSNRSQASSASSERPVPVSSRAPHPLVWAGAASVVGASGAVLIVWAVGNTIAGDYDRACFAAAMPSRSVCEMRRLSDQQTLDGLTVATGVGWALFGVGVAATGVGVGLSFWGRGASVQGRF